MGISVKVAVYGALHGGDENKAQACDVTGALQNAINSNDGVVRIDNHSMGTDSCVGFDKHFAAVIEREDGIRYFACGERQTIDFKHGGFVPKE